MSGSDHRPQKTSLRMNLRGHRSLVGVRISWANRNQLDYSGHGLYSTQGAEQVIADLKSRRFVSRLLLAHNELGDNGCIALFRYLTSAPLVVSEIVLTSNHIGNTGLLAIVDYLKNNQTLKKLSLQNNKFTSDPSTTQSFVAALNSSSLEALQLATSPGLADRFVAAFLPHLTSPLLQELNISSMHLSPAALPHIVAYLSSPHRCRLETFSCSANMLGTPGVKTLIEAVEQHNYRLCRLDIFSNQGRAEDVDSESLTEWRSTYALLTRVLVRNGQLKRATEEQAFCLLRYARMLLLCPASISPPPPPPPLPPPNQDQDQEGPPPVPVHFVALPIELKQHILSFFAPDLSSAQRVKIYTYASSLSTLPRLLPRLTDAIYNPPRCPVGHCTGFHSPPIGSRECHRERWLAAVGCDFYQPEGRCSL